MPAAQIQVMIRRCLSAVNDRQLADAAALFAPDAVIAPVLNRSFGRGCQGFSELATLWLAAFPDAQLAAKHIVVRNAFICEAQIAFTGTHRGALDLGSLIFRPTGIVAALDLRVLMEVRAGLITYWGWGLDVHQIVEQLVVVDSATVLEHLERIRKEGDLLAAAQGNTPRVREIVDRLGLEIDAARHAIRPYFKR